MYESEIQTFLGKFENPNTEAAYRKDLKQFSKFLEYSGLSFNSEGSENVLVVSKFLDTLTVSERTKHRKQSVILQFIGFLGWPVDYFSVVRPSVSKFCANVIGYGAIDKILWDRRLNSRVKAEIALMTFCGLRVSEIIELPRDFKAVDCPFDEVNDYLSEYKKERPHSKVDRLFLNYARKKASRQLVWKDVTSAGKLHNLKLNPQAVRASWFLRHLDSGLSIPEVSAICNIDVNNLRAIIAGYKNDTILRGFR